MGKAQIDLDTSRWPIAVVTPSGTVGDEELSKFFADYSNMLRGKVDQYVIIIDLRRATDMPAKQRKILTDYMKRQEHVATVLCAGTVLIFESAVMRAILTAVLWVRKPPQEVHVCGTIQEALDWAQGALRRKRVAA